MNKKNNTLYNERFEHDACGIGAVVDLNGVKKHKILDDALTIVERLEHRAGKDATGEIGDGVGIMLQISHSFFSKAAGQCGLNLGSECKYGVGMFFFSQNEIQRNLDIRMFEMITFREGFELLGWREVPVNSGILSMKARESMPVIMQAFIKKPKDISEGLEFDKLLYVIRREFEQSTNNSYVVSLSSRTIVYKGMFLVNQLRSFYSDLHDEDYTTAIAMVHSRFSTNTNPSWERAHPNRLILHNGEINTIRGNIDRMIAREETMDSEFLRRHKNKILPVINENGSDSAMLDNALEFLMMNGIDLPMAVMMLIPEPWARDAGFSREKRDMYHYYATMMEPWDGPAAVLFSDGDRVGAVLDRNGLRPARYYITDENYLVLSSETGVLDIPEDKIVKKGRLQPGKMLLADTLNKKIFSDEELKHYYAAQKPYGEWLDSYLTKLKDLPIPNKKIQEHESKQRQRLYKAFAYTYEDIYSYILPMAKDGVEPTASMGSDIPLAVLSDKNQLLFNYFKQLFAQVTNPPIDAIREEVITDTTVYIGSDGNLLHEKAENCNVLEVHNPILSDTDLLKIRHISKAGLRAETISILYYKNTSLESALNKMFVDCDRAYRDGANIIILSDRNVDENHLAIPSLLAVSSLEHHLIRTKKRTEVSVIIESAEPRDVHHFAALLGYGARAVSPYLAHECIKELIDNNMLDKDYYVAVEDYNEAILHGIVKVASKMGISTIQSYQSAQIFEILGINKEVTDKYFTNTISRIGGIGLDEIQESVEYNHNKAFDPMGLNTDLSVSSVGNHKMRSGEDKEEHLYNPKTIVTLQKSVRESNYDLFKEYTNLIDNKNKESAHSPRGLLKFDFESAASIDISEVEAASEIVKRFKTGAMSYGSLSQEAHECLAVAMNSLHARSNSGEGGELPSRLNTDKNSAIKQVASGRFGVTAEYLSSAKEIQIKMAQGAKPGEGGYLPGSKVYPWIAKTRYSTPGVPLISPPPHHDIYSIEDLAQLIYDLKCANRYSAISVKLVSEAGVGTIAAGVAKAGAQTILISGADGGIGAAPPTSIYDAGLPWELGLAETHQTLVKNGLRKRVKLETDGKLISGRDVIIACMLGAEEFGFATAPLVAMGCVMMRVCNLDTCPMGVATQNPQLRSRFNGKPEYVINFMLFIAEEMREIMAKLGIRKLDELIGRSEFLKVNSEKAKNIDLCAVINSNYSIPMHFEESEIYDFKLDETLQVKELVEKIKLNENNDIKRVKLNISNTDRTFGTVFGSEIVKNLKNKPEEDSYVIECSGYGGQSFGAFIPKGLTIKLTGDSNDYFGKGLSGGKLTVKPDEKSKLIPDENIIIGNVALYGATSGKAFINGIAGERFAVRNSGAYAVVEGVGDHGCEYMTGGRVVILGETGKNFAAGMSGGIAYISAKDKNVIVIGGGDTGNDCVATSIRHGCKSVVQIEMMPPLPKERPENNPWPEWPKVLKTDYGIEEAIAVFGSDPRIYQTTVKGINSNDAGNIISVTTIDLNPNYDNGFTMEEIENSKKTLPCDLLIIAAGFVGREDYIAESFGLNTTSRGVLETINNSQITSAEKVFAAGDVRRGQSLVVWAIAEGVNAAKAVDEYLMGYSNIN